MTRLAPIGPGVAALGLVGGGCPSGPGGPTGGPRRRRDRVPVCSSDGALTLATLPRTPLQPMMDRER